MKKADEKEIKASFAFIAMPIDKDDHQLVDVLETIKDAARRCGIAAERVDDTESNERITDRILKSIDSADYVIVDLTNERPNVFFEAGYAQGRGKTPIYIARQGTPLHFDIKDYPIIMFRNLKELREGLQKRLDALSASRPSHNSATSEGASGGPKHVPSVGGVDCNSYRGCLQREGLAATEPGIVTQAFEDRHLTKPAIVEFSDRFSVAFPGLRGVAWFDDIPTIAKRLRALLRPPLQDLAWWWRGSGCLQIRRFEYIEDSHFLMDIYELNVRRIAAVNQGDYYRKFVYVETDADQPTGLYSGEYTDKLIENNGYANEEYGLVDEKFLIHREEYDDGATIIDGEPVDVADRVQLRVRYITPYNFIIAPQQAPINNRDFEDGLEAYLNDLLRGKSVFDDMCNVIRRLPKRN